MVKDLQGVDLIQTIPVPRDREGRTIGSTRSMNLRASPSESRETSNLRCLWSLKSFIANRVKLSDSQSRPNTELNKVSGRASVLVRGGSVARPSTPWAPESLENGESGNEMSVSVEPSLGGRSMANEKFVSAVRG